MRERQRTNPDGRGSLLALWDSMKELTELIQRRSQNNVIEGTGADLKHWHLDDLADDLRINHDSMSCNGGLWDNAIVIILHYLKMCIELLDQPGEHNAGTVLEGGLGNLMDTIHWSNHNICSNNISSLE